MQQLSRGYHLSGNLAGVQMHRRAERAIMRAAHPCEYHFVELRPDGRSRCIALFGVKFHRVPDARRLGQHIGQKSIRHFFSLSRSWRSMNENDSSEVPRGLLAYQAG
jgi:hypothetical protein